MNAAPPGRFFVHLQYNQKTTGIANDEALMMGYGPNFAFISDQSFLGATLGRVQDTPLLPNPPDFDMKSNCPRVFGRRDPRRLILSKTW